MAFEDVLKRTQGVALKSPSPRWGGVGNDPAASGIPYGL
jgi:hypothetical protein